MHNIHLVVCKAESAEDACNTVETHIMDFGTENNWRSICGCVSEDNEVFINDSTGRYCPEEDLTIDKINKMVRGWMKGCFYGETAKKKLARSKGKIDLSKWTSSQLFSLRMLAKYHEQLGYFGDDIKNFDVLKNNFYAEEYTECGVTQISDDDEEGKKFVVFVDMHD